MGIPVSDSSPVVRFIQGTELLLYNISVLSLTPFMVSVLLFVIIPVWLLFRYCCYKKILKLRKFHVVALQIIRHIFFPLSTDDSSGVPRFKFFGFIAPVYYGYLLFYFFLMIAFNCIYIFLAISFFSIQEHTSCDSRGMVSESNNQTDCFLLSVDFIKGFSEVLSAFLALVVIYTYILMVLLKFSGGKQSYSELCGKNKQSRLRLARVIVTVMTQIFFGFVTKLIFTVYYIENHVDGGFSFGLLDEEGAYALSIIIDTLAFGMLTPWWSFEKEKEAEDRCISQKIETNGGARISTV